MLDIRFVHLYSDFEGLISLNQIRKDLLDIFPSFKIDVRKPFFERSLIPEIARLSKISDTKQPFEKQPRQSGNEFPLFDGFVLQRILSAGISDKENKLEHLHIIFTGLLTCTFDEDDWRYHGRAVICGTPSIISTTGMIEAPAKPREFYLDQMADKSKFAGRFLEYQDSRMTAVATGYALQAVFFFISDAAFCEDRNCRLFNAHWQEDLIRTQIEKPRICIKHMKIANLLNRRLVRSKRPRI